VRLEQRLALLAPLHQPGGDQRSSPLSDTIKRKMSYAQIARFARPNIQIYDARVVDLYEWVCARYLGGAKVQIQKQSVI
jgi:hypothetical protein